MSSDSFQVWRGLDAWRAELAHVRIEEGVLRARGTQIGVDPEPYDVRYRLETDGGFVTSSLFLTASGDGWGRRLELVRADDGTWTANGEPHDYAMAWIAVPELTVRRSEQRYEPIDATHVRYVSLDSDFTAELELDENGLVVRYPQMAEVVSSDGG